MILEVIVYLSVITLYMFNDLSLLFWIVSLLMTNSWEFFLTFYKYKNIVSEGDSLEK